MKKKSSKPAIQRIKPIGERPVLWGQKCSECGGKLFVPRAGKKPSVCSPTCRQRKKRRLSTEEKNSTGA